jgi:hypothetical protein
MTDMENDKTTMLAKLLLRQLTGWRESTLRRRDAVRVLRGFTGPDGQDVDAALQMLERLGYVRPLRESQRFGAQLGAV